MVLGSPEGLPTQKNWEMDEAPNEKEKLRTNDWTGKANGLEKKPQVALGIN